MKNSKKTKVLLVNPHGFDTSSVVPMSLAYLKANIKHPQNFEIEILDCSLLDIKADSYEFEEIIQRFMPEVVGITTWSPMFPEALNCAKAVKSVNSQAFTVMGGPHPTGYWKSVIEHDEIDFVFRGESEIDFSFFLDRVYEGSHDYQGIEGIVYKGKDTSVFEGAVALIDDLDLLKLPDYDAIQLKTYIERGYRYLTREKNNAPIWVTRGCPYRCEYCASPMISGKAVRKHSSQYLINWINELKKCYGIKHINIIDDNFTFDVRYAKKVCSDIADANLNVTISTPNGIRMERGSGELWKLMYKAGWRTMFVAPESGSPNTLSLMQKDLDLNVVPPIIRELQDAGLYVIGFFVLGYPGETYEDLLMTREFVVECGFDFFKFHVFQAIPGTPIYDKLVKEGQISSTYLPSEYHNFALATKPKPSYEFPNETGHPVNKNKQKTPLKEHYKNPNLIGISYRKYIIGTYIKYYIRHKLLAFKLFRHFGLKFITVRVLNTFNLMKIVGNSSTINWARK
jgi:anaerobic magnesium-protoporphyrin IX monomethyl ester cyclase